MTTKKAPAALAAEDSTGTATGLRRNFRDDAYWQPALRTDAAGRASFRVTFPDDITSWRTFTLAMGGKRGTGFAEGTIRSFKALSARLALPAFAVRGDSMTVIGKVLHYLPDSVRVKRTFTAGGLPPREAVLDLKHSWIDTFPVVAATEDSLALRYRIQKDDGYVEGEERRLPVFPAGTRETRGFFAALDRDTSFTLSMDTSLGTVKLYAETSVLPVLLDEMESIRRYEYGCNEQLASKLKALLLQKKVCGYLKQPFTGDKNIRELIGRLEQNRSGPLWAWWRAGDPLPWVSLHVTEAFLMAEAAGYRTGLNKQPAIDYLVFRLESYPPQERLMALRLLRALAAKVDYPAYLDTLPRVHPRQALYTKLRWLEARQAAGLPVALDTLVAKARLTLMGNLYWGEENHHLFDNSVQVTLLMYRLLQAAGGYDAQLRRVRQYFLEARKNGHWRNTYESSLILETILPGLLAEAGEAQGATLVLGGARNRTVRQFPFALEVAAGEKLTVRRSGNGPVYFTAYQQLWNPRPRKEGNGFAVRTYWERDGEPVEALRAGEPVTLQAEVEVTGDADYVLVELPIPAGCSYAGKTPSYRNNEVHREHFKNKVSIFCSRLEKGRYTFSVALMPRYAGRYQLNPARAEMMYFPVFYGREEGKKVDVRSR
ncbi:alpha-2-macroglobulin family protein [Paraflavisolibacter sp. H34]|uniref:alpha-2-macroglobulin family protein n=1 Tax=Huijunlia imazamoxiresistens TaxID=3127457 RepID=UPI0030183178